MAIAPPLRLALVILIAIGGVLVARADSHDAPPYTIHYNALGTMQLAPAAAERYGIARSPNRGLLSVTVLRQVEGKALPVAAQVVVTAAGASGSLKPIAMRRVGEAPQVDYLGELTVADREKVTFELLVTPEGATAPIRLRLQHQFFAQ